jgi:acyl-CoA thioester hydrolase
VIYLVRKMAQPVSTSVTMKVPYYDVDPMQIVWHGNYLKYFEAARYALFKKYGADMRYMEDTKYAFPVVRSTIKHIWPLRFDDEFTCMAVLKEARVRIVVDFEIKLVSNGKLCATGWTEQVAVRLPEMEMSFQIPEEIQKAFYGNERLK